MRNLKYDTNRSSLVESGLRIWHGHSGGAGRNYSTGLISGPGISTCHGCGKKKKNQTVKYDTNELIYETETESQTWRMDCGSQGGGGWERDGLGVWD